MFLGKYFPPSMVTKLRNEITNFRQRPDESLFEAQERYKLSIDRCPNHNMLPVTQIDTFYNGLTLRHRDTINAAAGGTIMKRRIVALKAEMAEINKNLMKVLHINQQVKAITPSYETCGGPPLYNDFPATVGQTQNVYAMGAYQGGSGILLSNTVTNPKEDLKGITTTSRTAYQGPMIPTTSSSLPKVLECESEVTKDTLHPTNNGSTKDVQPPVVQVESSIPISKPVVAPIIEPVVAPVSSPNPNQKPSISYPSRLHDQKLRDKANDQKEKFFKIFQDLNFNISFADSLILLPKFGPSIKSLLTNKDKLFELARTPLNEHCSSVLLKKLLEKLGDPGKFLIPCDFLEMDECLALADLGASINLMPLSVWNKLLLLELTPTLMTLELADRSISQPIGRSFLKTRKDFLDVFEGELTLRVGKEAITFNFDQTSRYSANYNDMRVNRIDVIDMACEKYLQEVLGFSDVIASGNPTPYNDPIISTSSLTLTPFGDSDFLFEEVDAFLALENDPTSPEEFYTHKILMEGDFEPAVQHQRRVNLKIHDVIKKEVLKLLDAGLIYPISESPWDDVYAFTTVTFKFPSLLKIKKRPHSRVLMERLPTIACILAYAVHRGIVLDQKIFKNRIEVDKAKVDVIVKLPHPTTVKVMLANSSNKELTAGT
nr:reverse transcriptase domain-containing protein [Tanacetum cinerariifolium]